MQNKLFPAALLLIATATAVAAQTAPSSAPAPMAVPEVSLQPSPALHTLADTINAAAEVAFTADYTTYAKSGKASSYEITGVLAKPNRARITVAPLNGAHPVSSALINSDGTTYMVVAPAKSQFASAQANNQGLDPDSTEANFFLYDVLGSPGIAGEGIADMLMPADFDITDEAVPAGIKRIVTTTSAPVVYGGVECTDVAQKIVGVRHTSIYHTVFASSDNTLKKVEIDNDDSGTPQPTEIVVFKELALLPQVESTVAFAYTPPAGISQYHAAAGVGSAAPDFTVAKSDGTPVHLSDYKGKVVVIDFWATWCPPCLKTLPSTDKLAAQYQPQGVVFMPVCTWDSKARYNTWIPQHKDWTMSWLFDSAGDDTAKSIATTRYAVSGIPTQCVIGKDGVIVYRGFADSDAGEAPLIAAIQKAMAAS